MDSSNMIQNSTCAVIVAHPDDETLWAGGTILMNPDNAWTIISTCRRSDRDRNPKYHTALTILHATGDMGDMDDGPEQLPLEKRDIEEAILSLLRSTTYDLVITHSPQGEYTRHRRHEEVAKAVIGLIETKRLTTNKLWMFAYEDGGREYLPKPIKSADKSVPLPPDIWKKKYQMITETYGFHRESWEAQSTPKTEAFWIFTSAEGVEKQILERSQTQ